MRAFVSSLALVFGVTICASAAADETTTTQPGVYVSPEVVIVGRVQRPSAVLEVRRVEPWVAVRELSRAQTGGIEDAAKRAPF
jgi:hypothetical protein